MQKLNVIPTITWTNIEKALRQPCSIWLSLKTSKHLLCQWTWRTSLKICYKPYFFYQEIFITAYLMTSLWIEFIGGAKKLGFGTAWQRRNTELLFMQYFILLFTIMWWNHERPIFSSKQVSQMLYVTRQTIAFFKKVCHNSHRWFNVKGYCQWKVVFNDERYSYIGYR